MNEFFTEFLKLYGATSALMLLAVVIAAVWLIAHRSTPPGKEVSVFFGLAKYTKGSTTETHDELRNFCNDVAGAWWSLRHWDPNSLGVVTITPDETAGTVIMNGRAHGLNGKPVAFWDSVASCINLKQRKIYYYWEGWTPASPAEEACGPPRSRERHEGFGEICFVDTAVPPRTAVGVFFDKNLIDVKNTTEKSTAYYRCVANEEEIVKSNQDDLIGVLVRRKLNKSQDAG